MASITISVQSLINAAKFDSYTKDDTITVGTLKSDIETAKGFDVDWFDLFYNGTLLDTTKTLAFYSIPSGASIYTGNKIANLSTKQAKQEAKLALAAIKRQLDGRRYSLDSSQLPTLYSGNNLVDNANTGGLVLGRPWTLPVVSSGLLANYDAATGITATEFLDSSGNDFHATLFGNPTAATVGGVTALRLDSANSQFFSYTSGYNIFASGSITHDIWFYTLDALTDQTLISEFGGYPYPDTWTDAQMGLTSGGYIKAALYTLNQSGGLGGGPGSGYTDNTWYNVVLVYNDPYQRLFVNGVAVDTIPVATRSAPPNAYFAYGRPDGAAGIYMGLTGYFNGYIGSAKLYSRGLSDEEVLQNFNALKSRFGL